MNVRYVPESQLWLVTGDIDGQYVVIMNTNMMAAMSRFREMQNAIVFRDVLRDMTLIEAGGFVADGPVDSAAFSLYVSGDPDHRYSQ